MSNNLIIINAHIVTPQGRTARKGEAMNELLNIPCGTVRITDGIITYVGENRTSHEKPRREGHGRPYPKPTLVVR